MKLIGVSGFSRSGKDLYATIAQKILEDVGLKTDRFALAYELKSDLLDLIYTKTGIDVFTEYTLEKNIIRPLLVSYGDLMRKISAGTYWTDKIHDRITKSKADVVFITDIRYDFYPDDECEWIKHKMNGQLVHITRYKLSSIPSNRRVSSTKIVKIYDGAPNDHELLNNPKVKLKADYAFEWVDCSDVCENKVDILTNKYIIDQVTKSLVALKLL